MGHRSLTDFLVGGLVGFMSMMPGASGGMIAVVFGIYERLIADLADIRNKLLKDLRFIVPVGLGIIVGLLVCAILINYLLEGWEVPMMFFFAALIICQVPDIRRMCDEGSDGKKPSVWNLMAFVIGLVVMVSFLFTGTSDSGISLEEMDIVDILLLVVIGVVVALSKIVPGLSGAAILLAIGLYTPLMGLVGDMDLSTLMDRALALLPIFIGFVVGAIGLSKIVDHLIANHRRSAYYCIFGLMIGSIITVCTDAIGQFNSDVAAASVICIIAGLVFGYIITKISTRYIDSSQTE